MTKTKTVITNEILEEVETLSAQGFNNIQIGQSLNIARQTLSTNKELKDSIQRGRLELSQKVTQTVLDTLDITPSNQQLLIKRLCLFTPIVPIVKPTTVKQALENLAIATKAYANGEINESQLRTVEAVCNSFIKAYEVINLEERLTVVEGLLNDR